jgi:hypothetical protein
MEYDHEKPDSGHQICEQRLHSKPRDNMNLTVTLVTKLDIKIRL